MEAIKSLLTRHTALVQQHANVHTRTQVRAWIAAAETDLPALDSIVQAIKAAHAADGAAAQALFDSLFPDFDRHSGARERMRQEANLERERARDDRDREIARLNAQLAQLRGTNTGLSAQVAELQEQLGQLRESEAELQQRTLERVAELTDVLADCDRLRRETEALRAQNDALQAQAQRQGRGGGFFTGLSMRMTVFALKAVLTDTRRLLVESEAEVQRLSQRVASLEADVVDDADDEATEEDLRDLRHLAQEHAWVSADDMLQAFAELRMGRRQDA